MEYAVIVEGGKGGFSAYVPDLPGCVAAAGTRHALEAMIREAIKLHLQLLRERGLAIPEPTSTALQVKVS